MASQITDKVPVLKNLLDFVFPPLCLGCGEFYDSEGDICETCRKRIQTYENPFCINCGLVLDQSLKCPQCGESSLLLFAWGDYEGPLKEIIVNFKFRGITTPAKYIAEKLVEQFESKIHELDADALLPIPLHPGREYIRGYNQAAVFAKQLEDRLRISVVEDILKRTKKRRPQARLALQARQRNVRGVFEVIKIPEQLTRLVLVDDVVTSGTTVMEAASTLKEAGYEIPAVISMAHRP